MMEKTDSLNIEIQLSSIFSEVGCNGIEQYARW